MFLVDQLRQFYDNLQYKDYQSAIAIVHSRFSTNTTPSWQRTLPNRIIAHNGEINTIRGNINHMLAREESMDSKFLSSEYTKILPVINAAGFTGIDSDIKNHFNITTTNRNTILTKANHYQTDNEKIFSAKDAHRGKSLVVWTIYEGKQCAKEVDKSLMGYSNIE